MRLKAVFLRTNRCRYAALRLTSAGGVTLSYDSTDRLYRKVGLEDIRFLYDGQDLIGEYDENGALLRRYVHGPGVDEPLVWNEGSDTSDRRLLTADERGSVIDVTTLNAASTSGTTAINTYDEYGVPGSSNIGRFQYTGQKWFAEGGVYDYKARAYSPRLGKFLQPDPAGYADGLNSYVYGAADPINVVDPDGMQTCLLYTYTHAVYHPGESMPDNGLSFSSSWSRCYDELGPPPNQASSSEHYTQGQADELVVTGRRNGQLGGKPILLYNHSGSVPVEQYFRVNGYSVVELSLPSVTYKCPSGLSSGADLSFSARGADYVVHVHPYGTQSYPGDGDYVIPRSGIPLYGITPIGSWRVNPGSPIRAPLLEGEWNWSKSDHRIWDRRANSSVRNPCTSVP